MRSDDDVLPLMAAECKTPTDVDMCIVAAFDVSAKLLTLKTTDRLGYLASWIALEQELAAADERATDGRNGPPDS